MCPTSGKLTVAMSGLSPNVVKVKLHGIQFLRGLFLQEFNSQVRYNACHERGWTDSYLLLNNDREIGYGAIKGDEPSGRDTVFEFYVIPPYRRSAGALFRALLATSKATRIECQSNDALMFCHVV
jgi:hypothetical protein